MLKVSGKYYEEDSSAQMQCISNSVDELRIASVVIMCRYVVFSTTWHFVLCAERSTQLRNRCAMQGLFSFCFCMESDIATYLSKDCSYGVHEAM